MAGSGKMDAEYQFKARQKLSEFKEAAYGLPKSDSGLAELKTAMDGLFEVAGDEKALHQFRADALKVATWVLSTRPFTEEERADFRGKAEAAVKGSPSIELSAALGEFKAALEKNGRILKRQATLF